MVSIILALVFVTAGQGERLEDLYLHGGFIYYQPELTSFVAPNPDTFITNHPVPKKMCEEPVIENQKEFVFWASCLYDYRKTLVDWFNKTNGDIETDLWSGGAIYRVLLSCQKAPDGIRKYWEEKKEFSCDELDREKLVAEVTIVAKIKEWIDLTFIYEMNSLTPGFVRIQERIDDLPKGTEVYEFFANLDQSPTSRE